MPAKSRGKKHNTQKRQHVKTAPVNAGTITPEDTRAAVATAARPVVKPTPTPATQPAPRQYYVGKELLRVFVVTVIVLALLGILVLVLR
jgi:hypothetical protein